MRSVVNRQIQELPRIRDIKSERVDRRYLVVSVLSVSIAFALLTSGGAVFLWMISERDVPWRWVSVLLAALWGLSSLYQVLAYRLLTYAVRQRDVSVTSGVVFRQTVVQPLTRLQHVELSRGPLERLFGLATLKLFSAGGAAHSLLVPGLPVERAERIKAFILDNKALDDE